MTSSTNGPGDLASQVQAHAEEIEGLLAASPPGAPGIEFEQLGTRVRIRPVGQNEKSGGVPLHIGDEVLAWLRLTVLCCLDSYDEWLAIDSS